MLENLNHNLKKNIKTANRNLIYTPLDMILYPKELKSNSVVVAGFWRSGTTWLQESIGKLIQGKTIFEPLHPRVENYENIINSQDLKIDLKEMRYFMPYWDGSNDCDTEFSNFLRLCLQGRVKSSWVRTLRNDITECLNSKTVVKYVRGQLCLHGISKSFSVPIVYIYRDPRAVIASSRRNGWGSFLSKISLEKALISVLSKDIDFFNIIRDDIKKIDRLDYVSKIAFLWCITEDFVRESLRNSNNIYFVKYEDMCKGDISSLRPFFEDQNLDFRDHDNLFFSAGDSKMTQGSRIGVNIQKRLSSWKDELSKDDIKKIESIVTQYSKNPILN